MSRVKINIPTQSEEHAAWAAKLAALEATDPEQRTNEQWDEVAALYENEPAYGEGSRTYYVPAFDEMPAEKVNSLPKSLREGAKNGSVSEYDALAGFLSMYMPAAAVKNLSMKQLQDVQKLIMGKNAGES